MSTESMVTQVDDLSIGQVQWHSSEEDGGPDVGILLRISETEELWLGELLDAEGPGFGFVLYGPGDARRVFDHEEYDDLRELVEEHIAPAIARTAAQPEREAALEEAELNRLAGRLCEIMHCEAGQITRMWAKQAVLEIAALTTPAPASEREAALEEALRKIVDATKYVENSYARDAFRIATAALTTPAPVPAHPPE